MLYQKSASWIYKQRKQKVRECLEMEGGTGAEGKKGMK